ncbi:MAG: MarR family transcriptional regulator, partial [Bacteroidales bacterium]|nr:MarR family transcriptional regulator [Bacteroidales bacterium]
MDANEKVIQTLKSAGKPMKTGEIAEAAGVDKKEVEKAIKKLV